ncbi:MAG TPA: TorF family putative porin [Burkholderiaceae bacterium]|nr:TorF family putative porin [Burkholderiaceae bacterium]HQR69821.1 TorF family putative porin [Burkholderiaceae bacterium]
MKKPIVAAAVAAACSTPMLAAAQTAAAPAKPEPEYTLTGNLTIASDYRFRGFTQTDYQPAIQGGVDFAHKSGFYLGNWNSNVSSGIFNGAPIEMDFYGGYKHSFGDFGLDVGLLYYYYPGTGEYGPYKAKNFEGYIGGSYGPVSVKYSYAFTNFFGIEAPGYNTKGSQYLDFSGSYPIGEFAIVGHAGWQFVKNYENINTTINKDNVWDYKLGGTWDIGGSGWVVGAFWVGTSEKDFFATAENPPRGAGRSGFLASLTKTF